MAIRTGTTVKWKWGSSWAEGTVQEDGTTVLKLQSEVERA